jgi:thioesterase domain-containing protein
LDQPSLPRSSPIIQIKAGSEKPPIFIAHGLCGIVRFTELARHIPTGQPIYGIQGKGIDGMEEPFERVEDMARFYLEELEKLYPQGPYILIGYSFGGLVALEMAQRLSETGTNVALLVLLDAYPHPRYMTWPVRLRLFATRARSHVSEMRQLPLPSVFSYFIRGLRRRLYISRALDESQGSSEMGLPFGEAALRRVKQKAYLAYASYQPRFYRGKINFVTAEIKSFFPGDPATVWADLAAELEVEVIPGNHLNIVTTQFKPLAAALTRYVQQVTRETLIKCD